MNVKYRHIGYVVFFAAAGFSLSLVLAWVSNDSTSRMNGFTRSFSASTPILLSKSPAAEGIKLISGLTENRIYFSSTTSGELIWYDMNTQNYHREMIIKDDSLLKQTHSSANLVVDSPYIYIFDGGHKFLSSGSFKGKRFESKHISQIFTRALPISSNTLILRKFKPGLRDQCLYLYNIVNDSVYNEKRVSAFRNDGGLSAEGQILFDKTKGRIGYMEHCSNKFTILDSNLNIIKSAHTIDTFSQTKIESDVIEKGREELITNGKPLQYVNFCGFMDNGHAFIISNIKADNESHENNSKHFDLDVYNVTSDLSYLTSYRLPKLNESRLRNFYVQNDKLILLTGKNLFIYKLPTL